MLPATATTLYDDNMAALGARFPELRDQVARCDQPLSFRFQMTETACGQVNLVSQLADGRQILFHEGDDIVGRLEQQMADWHLSGQDFLFCVGMGLGYLPLTASRQFSAKPRIVVIEPRVEILRLALECVDLRELLSYERLDLFVGPDLPVGEIIRSYGELIFFGKNRLVSHGPYRQIYPDFKTLETEVVDNIRVARNIGFTAKQAGQMIFRNTVRNLPNLFCGPDLKSLQGRFKGCPAICVAAGPSLDKALPMLKTVGHRALILCADSAVRSLVNEGISPHIVVTTDMNAVNFEKLRTSIHCLKEAVLVWSIEANPDNVGIFPGYRRIAVTSKNAMLNQWLGPRWSLDWRLPAMTSVSHTALFTAIGLGCGPIALVGMDFAYSAGKSHASGSVFRYPAARREMIEVDGVRGVPVPSLPQLITDRRQIENAMASDTSRFIDTSLDGALIRGAENRSLQEVLETMLTPDRDVTRILDDIDWRSPVGHHDVAAEFQAMAGQVETFISACREKYFLCGSDEPQTGNPPEGQGTEQRAEMVRKKLPAFDRRHRRILRLLKLIRYGDVKTLAGRMAELDIKHGPGGDHQQYAETALEVYGDYFTSLEEAAVRFKKALHSVIGYYLKEENILERIEKNPTTVSHLPDLARHYQRHDLLWKAAPAFRRYLDNQPDDLQVWQELGDMFVARRLWAPALDLAGSMKERFPDDAGAADFESEVRRNITNLLQKAADSLDAGAVDEARQLVGEYLGIGRRSDRARSLQKAIDAHDAKTQAAVMTPESLGILPNRKTSLEKKAEAALDSGDVETAVGIWEGLAQVDPRCEWQARERIGDIRHSLGDLAAALWQYRKAHDLKPENSALASKIRVTTGQATEGAHKMDNTIQYMISPETQTPEAMYADAQNSIEREAYPDAVATLEQLLLKFPDYGLAHNDLGVLYFSQGDNERSFFHYQEAARIEPRNTVFQKNLADFMYVVRGEAEPALKIYVELLGKDPMDKETLLALGQICADQGKFDDAQVFYRRIGEFDPLDSEARQKLAALSDRRSNASQQPVQERSPVSVLRSSHSATANRTTGYSSPVIRTEISAGSRSYVVHIPEQEVAGVDSLLSEKLFRVPDKRRTNAVYTVLDVGAGIGIFALSVHDRHPQSNIHCFEHDADRRSLLQANVGDLPGTVIYPYGLSSQHMEPATQADLAEAMDTGRQFDALGLSHLDILKINAPGNEAEILDSLGHRLEAVDYVLAAYHSEKARRAIDALLIRFRMFGAKILDTGMGMVKYVHPSLT